MTKIQYVVAQKDDKKQILDLLNTVFSVQERSSNNLRGDEFWGWKIELNVFRKTDVILAKKEGVVVGVGTMWPWEFQFDDTILKAFQPCDTVVSSDARGQGVFTNINKKRIEYANEHGADLIFNFPNANSLPGYLKMGWKFLGKISWRVKILKPHKVLMIMFSQNKKSIKVPVPSKLLLTKDKIAVIELLENASHQQIVINRKKGFYDWRYLEHSSRQYGVIFAGKKLESAAIFTLNKINNLTELVVVDLLGDRRQLKLLLKEITKEAKTMGVGLVLMMESSKIKPREYLRNGFIKRKEKNLVVYPLTTKLAERLVDIRNWSLVAALHDSI